MRLNENFLIHDTGSGEILIAVGEETRRFHGVVKLNETAAEICHLIEKNDLSLKEIVNHFVEKCPDDDQEMIRQGVEDFIKKLEKINAICL